MRYFNYMLRGSSDSIKANAKINCRDVAFRSNNPINTLNSYLYQNLKSSIVFLAYREERGAIYAAVAYDEKEGSYKENCKCINDMLSLFALTIHNIGACEITMSQFAECLNEAKRREYCDNGFAIKNNSKLNIFYQIPDKEGRFCLCDVQEKIVSMNIKKKGPIYDQSFLEELTNIENHQNICSYQGNLVHYIIANRSTEAASDMTEMLVQRLITAKRIECRRIEIISDIHPNFFRNDFIENLIENNYGGVIVFDLVEKMGYKTTDYGTTSEYIEKLVKKYRNQCLFIFSYNINQPGFAYSLLPKLQNYIIPVKLREGTTNRKEAVCYLKQLIKESEFAQYAKQANEFLKQFDGTEFTQTDILMAYEKFGSWCLNKNILQQAYNVDLSNDFILDRNENTESSYEQLNKLIGLNAVKKQIDEVLAADLVEKERKRIKQGHYQSSSMHMVFSGNPGTAKTTVARLFAGIAKEKNVLKSGIFVEKGGMDLNGMGSVYSIRQAFEAAKGGVLFIDEAYELKSETAVATLIQEMENHREEVIVILAGYNDSMLSFLELNEGLKSRLPFWIDFPDYDADELTEIFKMMVKEKDFEIDTDLLKEVHYICEKALHLDGFGNGRYVRNLMEATVNKQAVRLLNKNKCVSKISKKELFKLTKEDLRMVDEDLLSISDSESEKGTNCKITAGKAKKELDDMIGLSVVKKIIHKAIAGSKVRKLCMEKGIPRETASLHMVFEGNPGTAKTTVARLFAQIMADEKVLSSGKFMEVGRADIVGKYVGHTAGLVKKKFKEAQGGVLFIDEAYSLCDQSENGFGDEAINTIVQEMENNRDNVIVIFAGYPEKMKQFIDRNPGMASRIAFSIKFDDYTIEELCEITKLMLSKKHMIITEDAMDKLKKNYELIIDQPDFGNGRSVRKMLEEAEMNLAERISEVAESKITTEMLTTIREEDIPDVIINKGYKTIKIGF